MEKVSYNDECVMKQKDLEHLLWDAFWSFSHELGLEQSEERKETMVKRAQHIIPEFAADAINLEARFDYPLIDVCIVSLQLNKNILRAGEAKIMLEQQGPDINAKLFALDRILKERGIPWPSR